ncbi:hypothetical protein GCK72_008851 [Caenorhabditis remanei]|uniref:Uncharacterized protein n=1 Tax=Caenorhabditis remanei TaxID=31234 RepID=A0A6A5H2A5_CAERE|nr:hypothetical protein GCK72_008851 [Caenorhabditis remanei]KAF1760602.1 hypothetical protein GCK72_008851 [Caenorhabditis remanei]
MGNKNGESVWQFDKTVNWVNERGKRIKSLGDSPQFELLRHLLRKFVESEHWRVQLFTLWNQQRVDDRFRKKRLRRRVGILIWRVDCFPIIVNGKTPAVAAASMSIDSNGLTGRLAMFRLSNEKNEDGSNGRQHEGGRFPASEK